MTEIEKSLPIEEPSSNSTSTMDDEAYLMTLVENDDSLLPSNMTFSGLFEGDGDLNADELSDIAILLAPQVSDDDTGGSVSRSETSTPVDHQENEEMVATAAIVAAKTTSAEMPILPKFKAEVPAAAVVSPTGSQKRSFVLEDAATPEAPPLKKTKKSPSSKTSVPVQLVLQPKPDAPSLPLLSKTNATSAPNPLPPLDENSLATLAPKPAASAVINKLTNTATSAKTTTPKSSGKASAKKASSSRSGSKTTTADAPSSMTDPTDDNSSKGGTEEDRAQQCRDRNRQHARNTRLRKKAYVEELKKQLLDMVEERDAKLLEETQKAKIVEQQREVRFQVMQDFLQLRGRNEGNPQRWGAILEEGFSLTLPKTTFQTMVAPSQATDLDATMQVLDGVSDIMADSTYFASFLQTLGNNTTHHTHSPTTTTTSGDDTYIPVTTTFVYLCDRSNFLMDGCNAILNWTATSSGAVQSGARRELELSGTMRARFCPQTNRMEKAEMQFDTGLVHSQTSF